MHEQATSIGFIDGGFMPMAEMRVPVTDMGFQLGDLCYDTVHVKNGRFFRLKDHLDRWDQAVAARRYQSLDYNRGQIADILHGCVARAKLTDAMVYLVATRGTATGPMKDLRNYKNRFMAWAMPFFAVVAPEEVDSGCDIVIADTIRIPPEAVDPTVKNFARLDFVRASFEAYDRGARYAVLLDRDDNVTEGRGWNIFVLKDGVLMSPDSGVLEGMTRRTIMELSQTLNIESRLTKVPAKALAGADEVFLTSTAGGIMPVRSVDKMPVGDGAPGPVTTRLKTMYWALHDDPAYTTPVRYETAEA